LRAQFAHQLPLLVDQARLGAEQQQLVGTQVDGGAGGDVFAGQVEDLAGRRVAQRRQQHDGALVEQAVDALAVDPAHFAGVVVVDAFEHADRPRGDQVAAGHAQARALHRRSGHVHRQPRFDGDAQGADRIDHAVQGGRIGDAHAVVVVRGQAASGQAAFDLRARAVHQHQPHAQAVQQHQVVDDIAEIRVFHTVAGSMTTKVQSRWALM
jgi:hypothetical protein